VPHSRYRRSAISVHCGQTRKVPLDLVFEALRQAAGEVVQLGIPVEPGTACWIGSLDRRPVLGLASCELSGQPGALDLLLPTVLVGETLDPALVREIAFGVLLNGPPRVAPYHLATGS
jgi:molybdenum cofactor cytidylyltransferase